MVIIKDCRIKNIFLILVAITLFFTGCSYNLDGVKLLEETESEENLENIIEIEKYGTYTSKEEVALYIDIYERLPKNFITKKEARELGWNSKKGNLWEVAEGMSIGGDRFGNREGSLPEKEGRKYYECDINYNGGYRGNERIVYSNDGLIYYTGDHYNNFELIHGDD